MKIESNLLFGETMANRNLSMSMNGYVVTDGKWYQRPLRSPWSRIYYVLDGEGAFLRDGKEMKIEPGYVYFAPCGAVYGFEGRPSLTKLFFHVNIIMPDGYDLFSQSENRIVRFRRSADDMARFLEWYRSDNPAKHMMLNAELWRTVSEAARELLKSDGRRSGYSDAVNNAIEYIRNNLSASLKASDVATAVFCSVGNLNDRFERELGMTVAKYIDGLLMFEAGRMLAKGSKTVGEVSALLGYCDQFYFSRRFTKSFGVTPRDYKKMRSDS